MSRRKSDLFTETPSQRVSRNLFDLSHDVKMSGKFGLLYPVLLIDTLPGDVIRDQMTAFLRFAPMLAPVMHMIDVTTHFFFVPNRIICTPWEEFITGGQDGLADTILPYITPLGLEANLSAASMNEGTLWDYLGLPPKPDVDPTVFDHEQISILPFRAYQKVWNDYYRDPNLTTEKELNVELEGDVSAQSVAGGAALLTLMQRGWEKDYFTSALPWAQRGASVLLPLAGTGTVTYDAQSTWFDGAGGAPVLPGAGAAAFSAFGTLDAPGTGPTRVENIDQVILDESTVTINDFRRALAIQKWLENNARGGGRYIEQIESHFNTRVPDFRLQRAEYLGGGKQKVIISEVLATADSVDVPVGDMFGHGVSVGKSNRFTYRCQEHGWVLGVLSVMPKTAYSQGIDKMWTRVSRYDFGWPELAHLGEQEILSKEVFYSMDGDDHAANQGVFGYIPRYAEYKFRNDRVAGDFRSTLGFWHLTRNFSDRPVLANVFTTMFENASEEETFRRIFAVQDGTDYIWMQLFHRLTAKRPLPYFGVPQI